MNTLAESIADELLSEKSQSVSRARLQEACNVITRRLQNSQNFAERTCVFLCDFFNKQNHFDLCVVIGDAWLVFNGASPDVQKHRAQALINQGQLDSAEEAINCVLKSSPSLTPKQVKELRGLLCRISKQRYVRDPSREQLDNAIMQYLDLYDHDQYCDPCWHGINAIALINRARSESPGNLAIERQRQIIDAVKESALTKINADKNDVWSFATLCEAYLAECELEIHTGDSARLTSLREQVDLWLYRLLDHPYCNPFTLASLDRQLKEIWRANAYERAGGLASHMAGVIARFNDRCADFRSFSGNELSTLKEQALVAGALERNFTNARFFTAGSIRNLLKCCESIGCVVDPNGNRIGTGFLVEASAINPPWGAGLLFITNAHVVSADGSYDAMSIVNVSVVFDEDPAKTRHNVESFMYSSPPGREGEIRTKNDFLDVSILKLSSVPSGATGLKIAANTPRATGETKAFVIGHPNGAGLQISLHDAAILAIDPNERLIHYRTPTEPGSSGSPVFNSYWQLIAIHHAGSSQMPRFKIEPPPEYYEANEGVCISAIKKAVSSSAAHAPFE
jgi:V8-like Glu-specific endopeptidase